MRALQNWCGVECVLILNQEKEKNSQQLEQTSLENERILPEQRFA